MGGYIKKSLKIPKG